MRKYDNWLHIIIENDGKIEMLIRDEDEFQLFSYHTCFIKRTKDWLMNSIL